NAFLFGAERFSFCRAIIAEASGHLWVGTDWRLAAIRPDSTSAVRGSQPRIERDVPGGKLDCLLASRQGGGGGGYWRLADGRIQRWSAYQLQRDWGVYPWGPGIRVSAACEDGQGNLVVGTLGGGLFWFEAEGKTTCLTTNEGLSHNYILTLH